MTACGVALLSANVAAFFGTMKVPEAPWLNCAATSALDRSAMSWRHHVFFAL